jgi:hypothetical protein
MVRGDESRSAWDFSRHLRFVAPCFKRMYHVCIQINTHEMLLRKYAKQVLLLDEITVDLDVLARANLLTYLKKEGEERGATIIYATHIFDGLDDWPTHIVSVLSIFCRCKSRNSRSHITVVVECQVYIAHGKLQLALPLEKVKEMSQLSLMVSGTYMAQYVLSTAWSFIRFGVFISENSGGLVEERTR